MKVGRPVTPPHLGSVTVSGTSVEMERLWKVVSNHVKKYHDISIIAINDLKIVGHFLDGLLCPSVVYHS